MTRLPYATLLATLTLSGTAGVPGVLPAEPASWGQPCPAVAQESAPAEIASLDRRGRQAISLAVDGGGENAEKAKATLETLEYPSTRDMHLGTYLRPAAYVISFNADKFEGDGEAIISYGNTTLADNIVVVVSGFNSKVSNLAGPAGNAQRLFQAASLTDPTHKTAVIVWQGYDAPRESVLKADSAVKGSPGLACFLKRTRAWNSTARLGVVAHSYGAVLLAHTLSGPNAVTAGVLDYVAMVGAPGIAPAKRASDLSVRNGGAYVGAASSDVVTWIRLLGGVDPSSTDSGFTRFKAESRDRADSPTWKDHSKYFNERSPRRDGPDYTVTESLYSLASIVVGKTVTDGLAAQHRYLSSDMIKDPERDRTEIDEPRISKDWRLPSIADQLHTPDGIGDFGADGKADLVVVGTDRQVGNRINLYTYSSRSGYRQQRSLTQAPYPKPWDRVFALDLDHDRNADLVVAGTDEQSNGRINLYSYQSKNQYEQKKIVTSAPYPMPWDRLSVLDLDRDGQPDLVVTGMERQAREIVSLYAYRSGNGYKEEVFQTEAPLMQKWDVARVLDVDDDRRPDLVIIGRDRQPDGVVNLHSYESRKGYRQVRYPTRAPYPQTWDRMQIADVDKDLKPDLVVIGTAHQADAQVNLYTYRSGANYVQLRARTHAPYPMLWDVIS